MEANSEKVTVIMTRLKLNQRSLPNSLALHSQFLVRDKQQTELIPSVAEKTTNRDRNQIAAIDQAAQLNRYACREHVLTHFSAQRMTDGYEAVYQQILAERFSQNGHVRSLSRLRSTH